MRGDPATIRIGYAWAALGAQTTPALRGWNRRHPGSPLRLVRHNTHDAGLSEGLVDLAIIRHRLAQPELDSVVVGHESRLCVVAIDHPLADHRAVSLAELAPHPVAVDRQTGTTSASLWNDRGLDAPRTVPTGDIEEWIDLIAAGEAIGVTAAATAFQYPRPGVVYLPMPDAPAIEVRLAWNRGHRHPATDRIARHVAEIYAGSDAAAP